MALSDHDDAVLRELELGLRADTTRPARRPSVDRASRHSLTAAIGLMLIGVVAVAGGLGLANAFGVGLGVLGFLFIVGSCWSVTSLLRRPLQLTCADDRK
jgi:hypothetical protein